MPRKWSKSPAAHVAAFSEALPADARVERRQMFGYPCAFVNGNLFCGLHEHNICVRVGREQAETLITGAKAAVFAPMAGRVMREYVAVPAPDCADPARLAPWLKEALNYTSGLPSKGNFSSTAKVRVAKSTPVVAAKRRTTAKPQ